LNIGAGVQLKHKLPVSGKAVSGSGIAVIPALSIHA